MLLVRMLFTLPIRDDDDQWWLLPTILEFFESIQLQACLVARRTANPESWRTSLLDRRLL